jgi:alanine-synthesizing transaminase
VPNFDLRRVGTLPPYVFAAINDLKLELRRAGEDVVDLGFGNPDIPSPPVAVEKLREAVLNPRNHRYSASRGIPNLRRAVCDLYLRRFGVELDPETQALTTIGAKEGLAHLMWVLVQPGDAAVVPSPSYPIHLFAPAFAGAVVEQVPVGAAEEDLFGNVVEAFERSRPRPRVLLLSFPHNPTTATVELDFMQRVVDFAREQEVVVVHDFAYADLAFDGHRPPSILQIDGAAEVAVELYTLTKSFSMAGWRVGFVLGNADVVQALARLKSYLDYGTFQPIQIAAIVALNEAPDFPLEVCEIYRSRRDALCDGLDRIGWPVARPRGTMFVWAPIPEPYRDLGSLDFAVRLAREARVAVSPGVGFGPGGEEHVRFALVENEQRIGQAVAGLRRALPALASAREREAAVSPVPAKPPPNGPGGGG